MGCRARELGAPLTSAWLAGKRGGPSARLQTPCRGTGRRRGGKGKEKLRFQPPQAQAPIWEEVRVIRALLPSPDMELDTPR